MSIPKIVSSRWNHGLEPRIVCTVTAEHEIAFHPEDIIKVLMAAGSDDMAKIINSLAVIFNRDQLAEAYAADDLSAEAREFIDSIHFFMHAND